MCFHRSVWLIYFAFVAYVVIIEIVIRFSCNSNSSKCNYRIELGNFFLAARDSLLCFCFLLRESTKTEGGSGQENTGYCAVRPCYLRPSLVTLAMRVSD